jgi:hypothetical protein
MLFLVFLMISLPAFLDSRQMATAVHHYYDSPNAATRTEIDDARVADRKQIIEIELVHGAFLTLPAILFYKSGKSKWKPADQW